MFLVEDKRHGLTYLVFTWEDPRKSGYKGTVTEGVNLDYDMETVHSWPDGEEAPEPTVGRDPKRPKDYKVFKYERDREKEGYLPITGEAVVFGSWKEYTKLHLVPPDPALTDDQQWYDYLDKLDEDSRRRRLKSQPPDKPAGTSRDEVADWVAKTHLLADASIREIWYLPSGAPTDEIRLLELSDRLAGPEGRAEAIDFGLDVEGAPFRLFVADITSEQLDQIRCDPSYLPAGWSLGGGKVWRRGA